MQSPPHDMDSPPPSSASADGLHKHKHVVARGIMRALQALGVHVPTRAVFRMAEVVVACMSGEHRMYHGVKHALGVVPQVPEDDPLAHLAAVFHDIVHLKTDGELPPCTLPYLTRAGLITLPHEGQLPGLRVHSRSEETRRAEGDEARDTEDECTHTHTRSDSGVEGESSSSRASSIRRSGAASLLEHPFLVHIKHKGVRNDLPQLLPQGGHLARERMHVLCKPKSFALLALSHPWRVDHSPVGLAKEVLSWWAEPTEPRTHAMQKRRQVAQKMCYKLFGHEPGQVLDFSADAPGLSEFLSCVVVMDLLSPWLDELQLLHVCACIEATIPFRPSGCLDQLWARCMRVAVEDLEHTEASRTSIANRVHAAVESACRMVSRDLGNFASQDTRKFLANTWALLPELNPALRSPRTFTLRSWMQALAGNVGFYEFLGKRPERVFHRFGDSHSKKEHKRTLYRASTNLQRGRLYMGARLVTASIMHALLKRAGVDGDSRPVGRLLASGMGGLVPSNALRRMRTAAAHEDCSRTLEPHKDNSDDSGERSGRTCRTRALSTTFDFSDQGADAVAYVEQLLLRGFAEEDRAERGTDVDRGLFYSMCEASASVFRSMTALHREREREGEREEKEEEEEEKTVKGSEGCFERCVEAALAYLRDETPDYDAFLKRVPYDCEEYVATHVVAYMLDHV